MKKEKIDAYFEQVMSWKITFVTGNANKLKEVQKYLENSNINLTSKSIDLPELQGKCTKDIAIQKCKEAASILNCPVFTEDTSLCFRALNDLPGPYIKWFLSSIGHEGLNKMLVGFNDNRAYAVCTFCYSAGKDCEVVVFEGITEGRIVPARGPLTFGWDPIFEPLEGNGLTFAEMNIEQKQAISHRGRALDQLSEYFK